MLYILYVIFFASCVALIGSVLLQPGKTDAGALFTSNISSASLGPRGTASVLSKITIGAATAFMISALLIALPAVSGDFSVLQSVSEDPVTAPANTANANTEVPAVNANVAPAAETNAAPAAADSNNAPAVNTEAPSNK